MKRILYVEGCRDGTIGGSHTCLLRTVSTLDVARFDPTVVVYDDRQFAQTLRQIRIKVEVVPNVLPFSFSTRLLQVSALLRPVSLAVRPLQQGLNLVWHFLRPSLSCALAIRRWRIDIVHLNNSLNTNHEWMVGARLAGVKIVSHERGISQKLSRTSLRLGRGLDALICVSHATRDPLVRQGLDPSRIHVIYDGLDTSSMAFTTAPDDIRTSYAIPPDSPIIGVVGNIKHWKGQETVIRATAILKTTWPTIRCLLVGGIQSQDPYMNRLNRLVEELSLHENVVFAGFQANPLDFLRTMDVVVHSSIEPEPFGMVNLEAMYAGRPVVSTTIGGPSEIFDDGRTGLLIPPGDASVLADRVQFLLADPQYRLRIGQAAREEVVRRFNSADTVRRIEQVYDAL